MKRLNKIAKRITSYNEAVEQFINECEDSGKFDSSQMSIINDGFKQGLTLDEIKVYADNKFDYEQMSAMYQGFERGLSKNQVELYANSNFDSEKMWEIANDLFRLTEREVKEKYNL